jgi:hypothetical protein
VQIGQHRHDPSYVRLEVTAPTVEGLDKILTAIAQHGEVPVAMSDSQMVAADLHA